MDFTGEPYYRQTRTLLTLLAIWPYQKHTLAVKIWKFVRSSGFIIGSIAQLDTCLTSSCSIDYLLEAFPYMSVTMVYALKYITFIVNRDKVKQMLDRVQYDWSTVRNETELRILQEYAQVAVYITMTIAVIVSTTAMGFVIRPFLPVFLDLIAPLNYSRPINLPIRLVTIIDKEKYFALIIILIDLVVVIGAVVVLATESLSTFFVYHACGLFKIVNLRVQHAFNKNEIEGSATEKHRELHEKIVDIVDAHRRAVVFTDSIMNAFGLSYFILLVVGLAGLTLGIFRLHQALLISGELEELINSFLLFCVDLTYMLCANYMGQKIINYSSDVFDNIYSTRWYMAPVPAQKLLLFMMENSLERSALVLGGIFTSSYEGLSTLSRMAVSYFMFISSTR